MSLFVKRYHKYVNRRNKKGLNKRSIELKEKNTSSKEETSKKDDSNLNKNKNRNQPKSHDKPRKAYVTWGSDVESSSDEESNEDDDLTNVCFSTHLNDRRNKGHKSSKYD